MNSRHTSAVESFNTNRGYVRVTDDALVFEESTTRRVRLLFESYWQNGNTVQKGTFVAIVFAPVYAFGLLLWQVQSGAVENSYVGVLLLFVLVGIACLKLVDYARGFRSPDRIPLEDIETVSATRGSKGLTRPRLVITYTRGQQSYRRRVNLPSLYTPDAADQFERSLRFFEQRGFAPR